MTPLEILNKLSCRSVQQMSAESIELFNVDVDDVYLNIFENCLASLLDRGFKTRLERAPEYLCLICEVAGQTREMYVTLCSDGSTVYVDHLKNTVKTSFRSATNAKIINEICENMII